MSRPGAAGDRYGGGMAVQPAPHRFTVDEYHRMAEAGVFGEDDRMELVEGEIIEMAAICSRRAACVKRLNRLFQSALGSQVIVGVQDPVALGEHTELAPDVALLRLRADDYAHAHPGPDDIVLVVEVGDTTAAWDAQHKLPLYAAAGVEEVWLVDLTAGAVEVCRRPDGRTYRERRAVARGDSVSPAAFPDVTIAVESVLPAT